MSEAPLDTAGLDGSRGVLSMAHDCGEKHCQVCAVLYGFTAVHFTLADCGEHRTCASAGHTEDWSDWWAANSARATEPAGKRP